MTLTTTRLRALAQAATPGPVELCGDDCDDGDCCGYVLTSGGDVIETPGPSDAALYVALRNAIPELLEALELREACERLDAASGDARPLITWPVAGPNGDREYAALHRLGGPTRAPTLAALLLALGRP